MQLLLLADADSVAARADDLVVWVVLGLAFLWMVSFAAEVVMSKLRPVLMFLIVAGLVGVVVARLLSSL